MADNRRYIQMANIPMQAAFELDDYVWYEDSDETGNEPGQYKCTFADIYKPTVNVFAFAAYGGMRYINPTSVPWHDIGAIHRKIDVFNEQSVVTQRSITTDLVNSTVAIDTAGIYDYTINLTFTHNEAQQGRDTFVRFWDTVNLTPLGPDTIVGTPRNVAVTSFTLTDLLEIQAGEENIPIDIQIGGGDDYTTVVWDVAQIKFTSAGEYRGTGLSVMPVT